MWAKAILKSFQSKLDVFRQNFRALTLGFTAPTLVALIVCVIAGVALHQQNKQELKTARILSLGPTHYPLTDWIVEYFSCPQNEIESRCKQVFQRQKNGAYAITTEQFPLSRGRFVSDTKFSTRPTHARLSYRISDEQNRTLKEDINKDKPVLAMIGFPVCEGTRCQLDKLVLPLNRISLENKNWIHFDSPITPEGQFGPQTLPPIVSPSSKAHQIFSILEENRNGFLLEFGLAVLAPIVAIVLTIWIGRPPLFVAFIHFLVARSLWTLVAADTLTQQPNIFVNLSLKDSFALAAFLSGWVFATAMNFLSLVWCQSSLSRNLTTAMGSIFAVLALLSTYFVGLQPKSAVVTLRTLEFIIATCSALFIAAAHLSFKRRDWNNNLATFLRNIAQPEDGIRWERQITGLLVGFSLASAVGLWVLIEAARFPFAFNWSAIVTPCVLTFVLLNSRPQLTQADIQLHKNQVEQQETLIKLLSQLGGIRHRGQAVSLVVNFCNRELPRLGFESPQFLESQIETFHSENDRTYEVLVNSPVRTAQQNFGWIVARAHKRNEHTALGKRIIEALSSALALQLNNISRISVLETEAGAAQKFAPRELAVLFGITDINQLDVSQEYRFSGTVVSVLLHTPNSRGHELEGMPERGIIAELSGLFMKTLGEHGGYLAIQTGLKWTVIFKNTSNCALNWIENCQVMLRNWNQNRNLLSIPAYECSFGAQVSTLTLSFTEHAGSLRSWIQCDSQGVAEMLAEAACNYSATALVSQDYIRLLASERGFDDIPDAVRPLDKIWNRSKTATIDVFEFFGGEPDARRAAKQKTLETFSEGVKSYLSGQFDAAHNAIKRVTDIDPHDRAAQQLLSNLSHRDSLKAA